MDSFYIAACGTSDSSGVYRYAIENGTLRRLGFYRQNCASYLTFSENKRTLFVILEGKEFGGLASYSVAEDGSLEKRSEFLTPGEGCCHLAMAPGGRYVYAANYRDGALVRFSLSGDTITGAETVAKHTGHGPDADRQEAPHIHYTIVTPDRKYLCTVDLGIDCIDAYPFTADGDIDVSKAIRSVIQPAGSGPRHFIFAADGRTVYLVNELANTVMVLDYDDGHFAIRQTLSTLWSVENVDFSKASAIRLSPDGRYLLASNRGCDSIAVYAVGADGLLAQRSLVKVPGSFPRDFNFLPDGDYILAGCENSSDAFLYRFNASSGELALEDKVISQIPRPICIHW